MSTYSARWEPPLDQKCTNKGKKKEEGHRRAIIFIYNFPMADTLHWQAFLYYDVDPNCYVYVCYGASCSQVVIINIYRSYILWFDWSDKKYYHVISGSDIYNPLSVLVATEPCSHLLRNNHILNADFAAKWLLQVDFWISQNSQILILRAQQQFCPTVRQAPCTATRPSTDINWWDEPICH